MKYTELESDMEPSTKVVEGTHKKQFGDLNIFVTPEIIRLKFSLWFWSEAVKMYKNIGISVRS